ncbi:hypothetical protein DFH06DRAFT_1380231 [Mycena polygramma]|nr:hypothetical protein DFH06DRAFT_1380231 [Mycena polygramma]
MTTVNLSPEVEDIVIDHVHAKKATLGSCGLVCKSWLRSSRYHLLGHALVHADNWRVFIQLATSPLATFIPCIHTLSISESSRARPQAHCTPSQLRASTSCIDQIVLQLPVLPALKSLRLCLTPWTLVAKVTVDRLIHLVLNVTELRLRKVAFRRPADLFAFLSHFPQLRKLSVELAFWIGSSSTTGTQALDIPSNLQYVHLHGVYPDPAEHVITLLNAAACAPPILLQLGPLTRISIVPLGGLLCAVGSCLQALELDFHSDATADDVRTHIDLSRNTSLAHLALRDISPKEARNGPWALLEALHCNVPMLTLEVATSLVTFLNEFNWVRLNWTLRTHFSALRRLRIIAKDAYPLDRGEISLRRALAEYDSRGMLEVVVEFSDFFSDL